MKNYFYFSKNGRRGAFLLFILLVALMLIIHL